MSNTSTLRKNRTKPKSVKNQPSLGSFISECQKAGISLKDLSKIADSTKPPNNKRQRQPTGEASATITSSKKKPTSNTTPAPQTSNTVAAVDQLCIKMSEVDLLQELKNMEKRITTSLKCDKESELKNMEERLTKNLKDTIDKSMKEAIQTLTSNSETLVSNNPTVQTTSKEVNTLKLENARLTRQVQILTSEQSKLQQKIIIMEQRSLENAVVFRGIPEDMNETDYSMREKIYQELSFTLEGESSFVKIAMAKNMVIKRCKRVGRFSRTRARPITVEFLQCQDVEYILENKNFLRQGICVDREYVPEIERKRRILLPILKAAKQVNDYKKKCRLDKDKVVINGKHYGTDNLHQLPDELDVFDITTKSNADCIGFFGALNPLSNFYESRFEVEGVEYISSEQYIQSQKAIMFNDVSSYNKIMGATSSLDCKNAARTIKNFDRDRWEKTAETLCKAGIRAKFSQNQYLLEVLTEKTSNKTLVECANDRLWANGVPLYSDSCLDRQRWISQGLLGKLLEEVRSELSGAITTEKQPQLSMNIDTVTVSTTPIPVLVNNTTIINPSGFAEPAVEPMAQECEISGSNSS